MTTLAETIFERLTPAYERDRDPTRAAGQAAYMRDQFPFLGLDTTARRKLDRAVLSGLPKPQDDDMRAVAERAWDCDEREYQYFACDYLVAHGTQQITLIRDLVTTKSWWDTVDPLATRVTGRLVERHPELVETMDAWSVDENMWLVRTAILHQLHYKKETDTERLFAYCTRQAGHPDFFVRKAIGWALRHYARTDPGEVRAYVEENRTRLSPLSVREATKHL